MLVIHNRLTPFKSYDTISILGMLFCRKGTTITAGLIQHECIHTRQTIELGSVFFYLFYVIEWFTRLLMSGCAYLNISFEREAYRHMNDPNCLLSRRSYVWTRYLKNPNKSCTESPRKSS